MVPPLSVPSSWHTAWYMLALSKMYTMLHGPKLHCFWGIAWHRKQQTRGRNQLMGFLRSLLCSTWVLSEVMRQEEGLVLLLSRSDSDEPLNPANHHGARFLAYPRVGLHVRPTCLQGTRS